MPKLKSNTAILTANDLLTGAIVYWTGSAWSQDVATTRRARDEDARKILEADGKAQEAADIVVGAYLIALDPVTGEPLELRERRRLAGPSIPLPVNASF